jgi:2-polyprenyl-6-methoxyphenol hydroxylase-like FAD-dependent oxidoreductase
VLIGQYYNSSGKVSGGLTDQPARHLRRLPRPASHPGDGREDLLRALADHALAGGVPIEYGKRLVAAEPTSDGVTAVFADGTTAAADVLIGTDGIRSTVRTLIDPDAPGPEYQGVLSFGGYAAGSGVQAEPGTMYLAFGRTFIGYWRLPR